MCKKIVQVLNADFNKQHLRQKKTQTNVDSTKIVFLLELEQFAIELAGCPSHVSGKV